jgi:hypothetical protein
MPFRLELNRTRRQNIAPLEATGDLGISTIKIESNGTYFVEQGDTASIQVSGGGFVTIKAHPGDPVDKITIDFKNADTEVCYYHILFDRHQIVFSNGTPSESPHTGEMVRSALDQSALDEVLALFPALADRQSVGNLAALPVLKAYEARAILEHFAVSA